MSRPLRLIGLSGSLRRASVNTGLLRAAAELLPAGAALEIADIGELPLFNEDLRLAGPLPAVQALKDRLAGADGVVFAVTEHNYTLSAALKNAIDWASRPPVESPLKGKPALLMGAGGALGTGRAQYHLRQVLVSLDMAVLNKPELLVPYAHQKFDAEGNLTDATVREQLRAQLEAFVAWARRVG
ncbi:MAG TPA: NADPH-dependent FMN reductase [Alphaproteobacteria bacterium]|nr:NADPH-dependent FMN reductase [Alphaproteobacteria bacterium]